MRTSTSAGARASELARVHTHAHARTRARRDTDGEPEVMASFSGQAPSVHVDNNPTLSKKLEVEVQALRMGSVVANQWRAESLELSDKLRRVQQVLWTR